MKKRMHKLGTRLSSIATYSSPKFGKASIVVTLILIAVNILITRQHRTVFGTTVGDTLFWSVLLILAMSTIFLVMSVFGTMHRPSHYIYRHPDDDFEPDILTEFACMLWFAGSICIILGFSGYWWYVQCDCTRLQTFLILVATFIVALIAGFCAGIIGESIGKQYAIQGNWIQRIS